MSEGKKKMTRPEPLESSCHFFVERKRRYCRFRPSKNINYCAEHATLCGVDLGRKRVECLYDSKHTCYADKLNHHMKKCPSKPRDMPPYYSARINSGDNAGEDVPDPKETVLTVPIDDLQAIVDRVNILYQEHIGELEREVLSHPSLREELENQSYGTAAMRHRKQQASLIGQMEKLGLLTDCKCFLEMGAGKGQLSHWLHGAVENCKDIGFVLIDRSHVRNKMDNKHRDEMIMERIRIDIEHLRLGKVPSIEARERGIVAFGKHLCGLATDLALRCITETLTSGQDDQSAEGNPDRKRLKSDYRQLAGAVIALCCHHRCTWRPYVGKNFFRSCGLSARDFQIISSMSSWATCTWKGWSYQRRVAGQKLKAGGSVSDDSGDNEDSERRCETDSAKLDCNTDTAGGSSMEHVVEETLDDKTTADGSEVKVTSETGDQMSRDDDDEEEEEHGQDVKTTHTGITRKLSREEREMIGRKCKRLIDHGRVCFLNEHGLKSSLKVYIEEFYTPENVVLVAAT